MKVGDYVRTYDGVIGKIIDDNFAQEEKRYELDYNNKLYYFQQIVKSSTNIIDLIEVGDYVNGKKVIDTFIDYIFDYSEEFKVIRFSETNILHNANHIKSIVTKEQFSSMQYKVN